MTQQPLSAGEAAPRPQRDILSVQTSPVEVPELQQRQRRKMSRITDVFKQQKAGLPRQGRQGKKAEPELPGFTAEEATTNSDISEQERMLQQFDLATQFGPCTGMTRLERWERAQKFGLDPPATVRELLLGPDGDKWNQNLWHGRV